MTLAHYLTTWLKVPFTWGTNDCALFSARWVEIKTGKDHLVGIRSWSNKREAIRTLREVGGMKAALDRRLSRVHPNLARDGDLALYRSCLCIVSGPHVVGPSKNGLVFVSRLEAECAWSL